ncbi:hypothetical protein [Roseovarius sp. ZX-A-9]|uniref:hypothetical protein n=1 Tax=Roseovarius sp. ZX-A-9 TaxID=3014783 RepID=UPI00232EA630|nr:hypothetical protein [Roseovarius sp. ZX-A-9]
MHKYFYSMALVLCASASQADDWPQYAGLYLNVGENFVRLDPYVPNRRIKIGSAYAYGEKERFDNSLGWMGLRSISHEDYTNGPTIPLRYKNNKFKIVNVGRAGSELQRVDFIVSISDMANTVERPHSGSNTHPSPYAGHVQYYDGPSGVMNSYWGWNSEAAFNVRLVSNTVTVYEPNVGFCDPNIKSAGAYEEKVLTVYGYELSSLDGKRYIFKCEGSEF